MVEERQDDYGEYLIDNRNGRTLQRTFEKIGVDKVKQLRIAVGYFHVSGFNLIKEYLRNVEEIQLVIGTETDRPTVEQLSKGYRNAISHEIASSLNSLNDEMDVESLHELYEYIRAGRIDVRVYAERTFHAKAYIIRREAIHSDLAVIGSSNLSLRGLGGHDDSNTELNVIEANPAAMTALNGWFDRIWDEAEPYKDELMRIIGGSPPFVRQKDPDYVSPSKLFNIMACEYDNFPKPTREVLTEHQQVGVINARNSIERYGGCIVADSVGLGKTFIGIRLIDIAQKNGSNVLLLVPKSLKTNWRREIKRHFPDVDTTEERLKIMTVTELNNMDLREPQDSQRLSQIGDRYDFVVIDEAHRFRTHGEFKSDEEEYSGTKGHANLVWMRGDETKYALLTATPINNSVMDLYRLISIFTDNARLQNQDPKMNVESFKEYQKVDKSLRNLKKELKSGDSERSRDEIESDIAAKNAEAGPLRDRISAIINEVMVLRTKQNIMKDYTVSNVGGMSVVTEIPKVIKKDYDPGMDYIRMYSDVQTLILSLRIPHISMIKYKGAAINLSGLFRILLFKRLESGIHSFMVSIDRLRDKEEMFKQSVEKNGLAKTILTSGIDHLSDDPELEDFIEGMEEVKGENDAQDSLEKTAISDAEHDLRQIDEFKARYSDSILLGDERYSDPKLDQLKRIMSDMGRHKILIFTQYADTAEYLYDSLVDHASERGLRLDCIVGDPTRTSGSGLDTDKKIENFAPKANKILVEPGEEIDVLITTDTLSEGVNLQDCSTIINYDLPWNPMRIVQRVGRVDRIGSIARTTVFNIIPNAELEAFLSLLEKLETKITNITAIVGKENYILSEDEEIDPKTIGVRLREARTAEDYGQYENRSKDMFDFRTNDRHGQEILVLRQKMEELGMSCPGEPHGTAQPYSIIQENYELYSFVMFRIYDNRTGKKIQNIIIARDSMTEDIYTVSPNDPRILRLAHIARGLSKQKANPYEFEEHVTDIVKHFEQKEFSNICKRASIVNRMDGVVMPTGAPQLPVLGKLDNIIHGHQTTLIGSITEDDIQIAKECRDIMRSHKLKRADMSRLNHWYGGDNIQDGIKNISNQEFVQKTREFIDEFMTRARGYTPPRRKEDIAYSIVCKGASI